MRCRWTLGELGREIFTNRVIFNDGAFDRYKADKAENRIQLVSSRNVSDGVLARIACSRDWTRSYESELYLVSNPRTPMTYIAPLASHLRESDLKKLAQSKNVPGAVQTAARNQLHRKGK